MLCPGVAVGGTQKRYMMSSRPAELQLPESLDWRLGEKGIVELPGPMESKTRTLPESLRD